MGSEMCIRDSKKTLDFEIYQALLEIKMVKEKWKTASAMQKPVLEMEQERCEQFAALLQGVQEYPG